MALGIKGIHILSVFCFSVREPDSIQAFLFHGLTLTTSEHCVLNARTIC